MANLAEHSDAWRDAVARLYLEGLGVEDIAVRLGCDARSVWQHFHLLDSRGQFSRIEAQRKALWRRRWVGNHG